jgi:uncharacterized protein with HEPN domain
MSLEPGDRTRLTDMLHHAAIARRIIGEGTVRAFEADDVVRLAAVRCIEVIGEAGHKVSVGVQQSMPDIPWHLMWGMRNRLIHDYGNTDFGIVFKVVSEELPGLITTIEAFLAAQGPLPDDSTGSPGNKPA